ncbi:type I DNA topoisomerase [Algivirga pacifica]|uniref:DNA topoisomerase 1 n=1 Tax=Algivirga pacifica TaxID=1162670 RepID=A0ABP9DC44_9BACT
MSKNLVIVESPAKAKTIEKYLGQDYKVMSSYGHVRDLPKGNNAINIEQDFAPVYEISSDKKQVVSELKKLSKEVDVVWLATDDDREGEAISWHLLETLKLKNEKVKRIVFREITKKAILTAIDNPREVDLDLVNAQQARRVLDRLVGFELSPVLWKKVKAGLSAGRVQSVAVRIVVEREREISEFTPESAYKVQAVFDLEGGKQLVADLSKKLKTEEEARAFVEYCKEAAYSIQDLKVKPGKRTPAAPFTTSTLQQEASRKLGFPVSMTMSVAQKLYEAGHITYMRTDSVNLSDDAIAAVSAEISKAYGEDYVQTRAYKSKSKSAQEAHEAIRPTNFQFHTLEGIDSREAKLYDLIWKRTVASQMADAKLEKTTAYISIDSPAEGEYDYTLQASGEVIKFEGFLKVYLESTDEEEDEEQKGMLPPLSVGQSLDLNKMVATERFSRPPARYTEASLVKKLEELGIGRPSTYAPTISTIQKRDYVVKEPREGKERDYKEITLTKGQIAEETRTEITGAEKNKLFPTNTGMIVNDFLVKYFPGIVDYSFTARVEEQFDLIAHGKLVWNQMIKDFYGSFHQKVEDTSEVERADVSAARLLGEDPKTGRNIYARLGRFGPIVQLGEQEDEDKTYASMRKGQYIENITLEEALELFKLPRVVGEFEGKEITANVGRFGPYVRHDGKFASLGKELAPETVTEEEAIALILTKREADAKKLIKSFEQDADLQVLNGRWGPYISYKKKNYKIPKGTEAEKLTYGDCIKLIEEAPDPKAKKKTATKKTATKKTTTAKKTTTRKTTTAKKK